MSNIFNDQDFGAKKEVENVQNKIIEALPLSAGAKWFQPSFVFNLHLA
jgi:hypothetical protein